MKGFLKWFVFLLLAVVAFVLLTAFKVIVAPDRQAESLDQLSPVIGAISLLVGGATAFVFSVWPGLRTAFDKIDYNYKPVVMFGVFVLFAGVAAILRCNNLYDAGVTCPAYPADWINLLVYAGLAWAGSQWAHANGGSALAASLKHKDAVSALNKPKG